MPKFFKNKYFLLGLMALTWGSSYILIKKTLVVFNPYEIGSFRVAFTGLFLAFIGVPFLLKSTKKELFWLSLAGFFGIFAPMFIFPIAQTRVSSSLAGMINALEPIFTIVFGLLLFGLRIKPKQAFGAVIGFLGAAILLYFSEAGVNRSYAFYTILMVVASMFYAISALIVQSKLDHIKSSTLTGSVYTLWMIPSWGILYYSGFFTETDFQASETWNAMGILIFLTVVSTTLAMFLFYKLIQDTSAVFASTVSLLIPVVAVLWGIWDGEEFLIWYGIGGALILLGVYLIREKKEVTDLPTRPQIDSLN